MKKINLKNILRKTFNKKAKKKKQVAKKVIKVKKVPKLSNVKKIAKESKIRKKTKPISKILPEMNYGSIGYEYIDIAKGKRDFAILSKLSPWDHLPRNRIALNHFPNGNQRAPPL